MSQTNGHRTHRLREQLSELRLEHRVAELRVELAQTRLAEHWGGWGWGGGAGLDQQFGQQPGMDFAPALIAGNRMGRRDGRNLPFLWTEINMDLARGQARRLATENRIAIGILEHLAGFTVKTGFEYEGRPKKGMEKDATAVEVARVLQQVADEFIELNEWQVREKESCWWAVVDGERFLRTFAQDDGSTLVREIDPEQVGQPPGHAADPHCLYGIRTDPRDVETVLEYFITYDGLDYETVPGAEVVWMKRNVPRTVKRGLSDFYSTAPAQQQLEKLLDNMTAAGSVQSAIAWIEQFAQANAATVGAAAANRRDQNRPQALNPWTGRPANYQRYEAGSILAVGAGKEYLPPPQAVGASVHIQIVQAGLRAIGNRWCMPEYMVSGEADEVVANAMVSGSPFVTKIECEQALAFKPFFLRVLWTAVRNAANHGRFRAGGRTLTYPEVRQLVDLHATPPKVAVSAKADDWAVDSGLLDKGAMSLQTLRARHDLDSDQERANLLQEPLPKPAPPGQPGQPGAAGGQPSASPFFPPRIAAG